MNSTAWTTSMSSLQWFLFIFANTIVVPVSIGVGFDLPPTEMAGMIRNSLVFTGLACLMQGWIGHRLPIMEGHSGVMWGTVLQLGVSGSAMGMSLTEIGGGIATGILLSGLLAIVISACGLLPLVKRLFPPMVVTVYLFLLTFQLILIFFDGMFIYRADGSVEVGAALLSVSIVVLVCWLKIKGKGSLSNFSILIGMVAGWVIYAIVFAQGEAVSFHSQPVTEIVIFPLGTPNLHAGMIVVTMIAGFVNWSNTFASVKAGSDLIGLPESRARVKRSFLLTGSYSVGASVLGLVPYAPFTSSIGFLESTQIFKRKPFLYGGGMMMLIGLVPYGADLLATMPVTIGNAVLFAAYLQLFGSSLRSIGTTTFDSVSIHRIALPILAGLSLMTLDAQAFASIPSLIQPILANGFVVGVLLSVVLERLVKWKDG